MVVFVVYMVAAALASVASGYRRSISVHASLLKLTCAGEENTRLRQPSTFVRLSRCPPISRYVSETSNAENITFYTSSVLYRDWRVVMVRRRDQSSAVSSMGTIHNASLYTSIDLLEAAILYLS